MLTTWWTGVSVVAVMMFQAMAPASAGEVTGDSRPVPFSVRTSVNTVDGYDSERATTLPRSAVKKDVLPDSGGPLIDGYDLVRISTGTGSGSMTDRDFIPPGTRVLINGFDTDRMVPVATFSNISTNNYRPLNDKVILPRAQSRITLSGDRKQVILTVPTRSMVKASSALNSGEWSPVPTTASGQVQLPVDSSSGDQARFFRVFSPDPSAE